ncbi:response regulator [Pedobacter sp. P351]|uniref:response regulator n=1 Tax=Pedobacter superstes TaxID=3133441 RepID=UPI0030ABC884
MPVHFDPDPKRVIVRFFMPGGPVRAKKIISRVMGLSESDALQVLNQTLRDFSNRHRNITRIFFKHFDRVTNLLTELGYDPEKIQKERKLLVGAYFTHEYSIESAAFFNPSVVEDPDQSHLQKNQKRIIVSFRATGEGHVSSVVFRGGVLGADNNIEFNPAGRLVDEAETIQVHVYEKSNFLHKLHDMQLEDYDIVDKIFSQLGDTFVFNELRNSIAEYQKNNEIKITDEKVLQSIKWIANAQYQITFSLDTAIAERVIFPISDSESNGIEDARFVRFTEDDGTVRYYATYTAYNGFVILPQLIETTDFYTFNIMPIYGKHAQNKGMALFPKKVNGLYSMLSRNDGENNYIMFSDQINNWDNEPVLLQEPRFPWEFIQLGNSGSPVETDKGWLVITHGVGAMRRYCMGAILLHQDDPTKVIGQLPIPLLMANEDEREGYVPNVVYSCGAIIYNNALIIPYAMSDYSSGFASVSMDELFENMLFERSESETKRIAKQSRNILLAEDNELSRLITAKILTDEGYNVVLAVDGMDALMELSKQHFDLILTDISMPNITGYQLLEYLKTKNIKIPVVFLTSHISEEDEIKGLEQGAVEYLRKPITKNLLSLRVNKLFDLK